MRRSSHGGIGGLGLGLGAGLVNSDSFRVGCAIGAAGGCGGDGGGDAVPLATGGMGATFLLAARNAAAGEGDGRRRRMGARVVLAILRHARTGPGEGLGPGVG